MGSTNHGTQTITWQYFMDAKAFDFNQKDVNVLPRGIYKGGHLTRVTDSEIKLLPLTVVLGDADVQVSIKTEVFALLNAGTLDSGTISVATPYIVLRWAFVESVSNYMEVHAVALGDIQVNDIVVGKCVISGGGVLNPVFDYSNRTFLNVQNIVLRVEESELSELYVWVRAGRLQTTAQTISVPEQKIGPFTNPGAPNSRIDLVYVDTDGSIKIQQGTAAVSPTVPAYAGKLVIAEVRLVNGESYIPVSRITDVRSSLIQNVGMTPQIYAGEESVTFPNGMIEKTGKISVLQDSSQTVTFAVPFPNANLHIYLTEEYNILDITSTGLLSYGNSTVNGFTIRKGSNNTTMVHWIAKGY
jgi:hypothetical protein